MHANNMTSSAKLVSDTLVIYEPGNENTVLSQMVLKKSDENISQQYTLTYELVGINVETAQGVLIQEYTKGTDEYNLLISETFTSHFFVQDIAYGVRVIDETNCVIYEEVSYADQKVLNRYYATYVIDEVKGTISFSFNNKSVDTVKVWECKIDAKNIYINAKNPIPDFYYQFRDQHISVLKKVA